MAKGKNDLILRDRLQFTLSGGSLPVVYGRLDLSDYVSVVDNNGLSIKEIRYQFRNPTGNAAGMPLNIGVDSTAAESALQVFATTTAYEDGATVGIASPNVINFCEMRSYNNGRADDANLTGLNDNDWIEWSVPDLHPEGYMVVTDVLIGICADSVLNTTIENATLELDVMMIAEPKKITKADLNDMLTQTQDL
tara:strand:+ start:87 stop:668 length:582 start_codon:yes stop_codon:yes gene_type:complete